MAAVERHHWFDPAETEPGRFLLGHILLIAIGALVAVFLVWSNWAVLDEVTRGEGRVIPSSQVQVIQNLEGGILAEVLVHEGDVVDKGQVVMRIDNTTAESNLEDLQAQKWSLMAVIARLSAEAEGVASEKDIKFPAELLKVAPQFAAAQRDLFVARAAQLQSQIATLKTQAQQRQQELTELNGKLKSLEQSAALAKKELTITRPLAAQGVVSQVELLKKEREYNDIMGDLNATRLALPRAKAALQEAISRIAEQEATFRADASTDLNNQRTQLASVEAQLTAGRDRVTRTEVRSPVKGRVKEIKVRTIGGVIQPGQDLMEIVPIEDTLLIEAQIRPSDVAFLHPGQKATVKITAYDYSIYGGLDATLEDISADTIEDTTGEHQGERFFRVRLRTVKNFLGTPETPLPIIPGMTATVDIRTGQKTVFQYLMKPILKARQSALRER
ncbi:MAG: HlyD family type I secretion periplasmic adaptor subunit [Rhodospirillaceae bacterium]|nr:HlyD family type I secretion periplasmic adaptor subunit [Rhodospirillaceae bacterium]